MKFMIMIIDRVEAERWKTASVTTNNDEERKVSPFFIHGCLSLVSLIFLSRFNERLEDY